MIKYFVTIAVIIVLICLGYYLFRDNRGVEYNVPVDNSEVEQNIYTPVACTNDDGVIVECKG